MINYTLKCDKNHRFDSWFKSAEAFDMLIKKSLIFTAESAEEKNKKDVFLYGLCGEKEKCPAVKFRVGLEKGKNSLFYNRQTILSLKR